MIPMAERQVTSPAKVLERLSAGKLVQDRWVEGSLDLDPLVVSRWLCGEDMRGVYQPIVLHNCLLDDLDLHGRTFYETVELVDCRVMVAHFVCSYFYSILQVEDCVFDGEFQGRGIQNDGRMMINNTVFAGPADFSDLIIGGRVSLSDVSFPGGTNLLHVLAQSPQYQLGTTITFNACRFRAADVPEDIDCAQLGIDILEEHEPADPAG